MRESTSAGATRLILILCILGVAIFPIYWMLVTSLTSSGDLFLDMPRLIPDFSQAAIYREIFVTIPVLRWLSNSATVAAGTMVLTIALAVFPAYALSRFRFKGMTIVGFSLFVTQMLPEAMLVVPLYILFGKLGILDSLWGLVLANTAFTVPVVTWILKGAIDSIPMEIEEAATVDGCSHFGIVLSVVVPLIAPTLAATAVIAFFHGWNEYVFAQTLVSSESLRTASVGLASFVGEFATPIHAVMAVGFVYTLPAVAFYLFAQRYVVAGMTAGSVKG